MKKLYAVLVFVILGLINADGFQQTENNKALPSGERATVSEDVFIHSSIDTDSMLIERGSSTPRYTNSFLKGSRFTIKIQPRGSALVK